MNIYADNAATTKLDIEAFESMKQFLIDDYANASQPYSFSRNAKKAIKNARQTIAECINAKPNEIFFTSGGTESDNWAIKGFLKYGDIRPVITSQIEHHAVLNACNSIEQLGYPVVYLPVNNQGVVLPEKLKKTITSNTKLVSVMLANNEIGTVEPICELAEIAHKNGALFHTDAVQAVGHIPVDVQELGIDLMSASAHKFNGPKGIGFLYIKNGTPIKSFVDGGTQEMGLRAGTENVASIVGMAIALKNNVSMLDENTKHIQKMSSLLLSELNSKKIDFILNGHPINRLPGNLSLSFRNKKGEALLHLLDLKGICISTGSACDSRNTQISHVISAIEVVDEYAEGTIRISLGKDNTEQDIRRISTELINALELN